MLKKQDAIVLKSIDYGETNKIVTLFTKEDGKLAVLAKGAKKPNSRFAAVTQPFVYGSYLYFQGNGLPSLSQGEAVDSFKELQFDIVKSAYAAYITELVDKLTEERKPTFFLFDWLLLALRQINTGQDAEIIARIMDMKMLPLAGAKPELDCCACCRSETRDPVAFSVAYAGFLCSNCIHKDERAFPITLPFAKLFRVLYYVDLTKVGTISVKAETKRRLEWMIRTYYDEYVGVQLKARRFISQLDKIGGLSSDVDK
ncbi:DNA repair protein RecO [Shouchella clausii]|uniref:DNA repair protein RecO n=1 Tax=Shouchella clausii TaxID=79880 RepID=UPI0026F7E536|nr:DNA repair protein RecO [Shouchella clausii]MDO7268515.1 DNA repair protein RecO [Shouchella clausii]MDO7288395.1 DNA repair protein RecO [Shouchella clausii]